MARLVGVDVGTHTVRAVAIRTGFKKSFLVEKAIEEPIALDPSGASPREAALEALRSVVGRLPSPNDGVYAALAGDAVSLRIVELPAAAARRIEQVLPFELEGNIAFDVADSVVDHQPLGGPGGSGKGIKLLSATAPKERVRREIAFYAEAGLDPRELGCEPLVYGELTAHTPLSAGPDATAIVDIGHDRTSVTVLRVGTDHTQAVEFARTLSRGGRHVTAALAQGLGLAPLGAEEGKIAQGFLAPPGYQPPSPAHARVAQIIRSAIEPFIRDLRQTLGAYRAATGASVGLLYLAGGGARLKGIAEVLGAELGIEVATYPFPAVPGAPADEAEALGFVKALALALRGASRAKRIDFRKGELAPKVSTREARGVAVWTAVYAAALLIAWGFSAFAHYSVLDSEREAQVAKLRTVTKQLLGTEIDDFMRAQELAKGARSIADPMPKADAFVVVDELSRRITATVAHDIDDLDIRPDRVTLRGQVTSLTDVDTVYEALSEYECFTNIQKGRVTRTVDGTRQKYNFDITLECPDELESEGDGQARRRMATRAQDEEEDL